MAVAPERPTAPSERPVIPSSPIERGRAWLAWFGVARLVTAAVATIVVCLGGWWLVRTPVPATESSLPLTTGVPASAAPAAGGSSPGGTSFGGTSSGGTASDGPSPPASAGASTTGVGDAAAGDGDGVPGSVGRMVVHVTGAVARPGVYDFDVGARVADAIDSAGGATADGRPHELNLAALLVDGMRLRVPTDADASDDAPLVEVAARASGSVGSGDVASRESGDVASDALIDLNRATATDLERLPGVGPATAAAIITERERNGPFVSVADLERVPGIGPAKSAALRDLVVT